jgi:hypothetical protein
MIDLEGVGKLLRGTGSIRSPGRELKSESSRNGEA